MRALIVVVMATLAGCASAPRNPDTAPSPSSAASLENTESKAAPAAASSESKAAPAGDKKRAFKPPLGWKVKIDDWDIVYCRKMTVLGTRFPKEVCMTEVQLREEMARNAAMRNEMDKASRVCGTICN